MTALLLALKFLHFIGLALGVGSSFALTALGSSAQELAPEERAKFLLRAAVVRKGSAYGLALLLLSGIGILVLRGPAEVMRYGGGFFHLKLTLVVILFGVFGYSQSVAKKVRQAGGGPLMPKLATLGRITLLLGVAIVASAVAAFK